MATMSSILKSESIEVGSTLLLASGALAILLAATLSGLEFGFWPVSGFYIGFISIFIALGNKNRLRLSRSSEVAGILSLLALIIGSWLVAPSYISLILIVVLMAEAPYILSKRQSWILLAVSNLAFFAVFMGVWQASNIVLDWISMFALQAFALTSSLARVQETQLKHTLADQNAELTAARSALAEKSQMEERLRIAGDLHDGIGHQITALRLQLEALFQLAPAQLKPRVANSQQLSGELLENIRSIVKRMSCVQIVELDTLIKQID
jgi:signal transduction histidine kinase